MEIVDVLIVFFLGGLGIHRFMKKFNLSGIVYLCTGGLLGIGWLIDFIYTLTDKELMWQK
jgi:TM2 domain-containing membrane protein YozV